MPPVAKRRNIASIRRGGSFAPPSSHQVITAMKAPTTYWTTSSREMASADFLSTLAASFVAHQIGEYLANSAQSDGTAAAANQRPIEIDMVLGMFKHGQAEAQTSVLDISGCRQRFLLAIDELLAQMLEAAPS